MMNDPYGNRKYSIINALIIKGPQKNDFGTRTWYVVKKAMVNVVNKYAMEVYSVTSPHHIFRSSDFKKSSST